MANRLRKDRPSRLKPPPRVDPLDGVGLVSKGDKSLLNHKAQEDYFNTITTRYHTFTGIPEVRDQDADGFAAIFASLSLNRAAASTTGPSISPRPITSNPDMSTMILAMRKLREAIVASSRRDEFVKTVYLFIIRTTILLGYPESYHPALLYLFRCIHPLLPLDEETVGEFVGYHILDLTCRQQDFASAFHVRSLYNYRCRKVDMVLTALVHGNWALFYQAKRNVKITVYERRLIEWADGGMIDHALQCLGKSYLSVNKGYVEQCTGTEWEKLKELKKVPWTCDGQTVTIRQARK